MADGLNSPNDLVYRSEGSLYFTDPTFGLPSQAAGDPVQELPFQGSIAYPQQCARSPAPGPPALVCNCELGTIRFEAPVGNLAWGNPGWKSLYITASAAVYSIRVSLPGVPLPSVRRDPW